MNVRPLLLVAAITALIAGPFACGDDSNVGGAATSSSVQGTVASVSHVTAATGPGECTDFVSSFEPTCADCLVTSCCAAVVEAQGTLTVPVLLECAQDMCDACFVVTPPPFDLQCTVPTGAGDGSCVAIDDLDIKCNPITNEGCPDAGASCDRSANGFQCFLAGNDHDLCENCSSTQGFCKAGEACVGQCARYCCSDAECSPGHCLKTDTDGSPLFSQADGVGVCGVEASPATTSSSSSSSSSGSTGGAGGATASGTGGTGGV